MTARAGSLGVALALGALLAFAAPAAAAPLVSVTLTVAPTTSPPGSVATITAAVKNTGTVDLFDVTVAPQAADAPLTVEPASQTVGDIGLTQTATAVLVVRFADDAPPGFYRVPVLVSYRSLGAFDDVLQTATLTVRSSPSLVLRSVDPSTVPLGGQAALTLRVANEGPTPLTNVDAAWSTPDDVVLPLGDSNRIVLPRLEAGEVRDVVVLAATSPGTAAGVYPLTFVATFADASGASQTSTSVVGVRVGGATTFALAAERLTASALTLSIANVGGSPGRGVELRAHADGPLRFAAAPVAFLGTLDEGDFTSATFPLRGRVGDGPLRVDVVYTPVDGARTTETREVALPAAADPDAGGPPFGQVAGGLLLVAAAGAAALVAWRRHRRSARSGPDPGGVR